MTHGSARLPAAAKIVDITTDNYRTKTFTLDACLAACPGQFVMVWLPGFDEKPFSLVSADPVRVMITDVGPFTGLVHEKQPGEHLWLRGPFGNGFTVAGNERHAVLIGGGYGVAPILWLAQELSGRAARVTAIVGARTERDLLYVDRFRLLPEADTGTARELVITTDDGSAGQAGLVTDSLRRLLEDSHVDAVFACGPHPMLAAIREAALGHGVPCQLSWEEYMRCGMGLCGSCELEGALLCMDGPVLAYAA